MDQMVNENTVICRNCKRIDINDEEFCPQCQGLYYNEIWEVKRNKNGIGKNGKQRWKRSQLNK